MTRPAQDHPFYSAMLEAARLAEYGRGPTAPNPTVGAVLVQNGQIVARGWHRQFGGAHAEINALEDARKKGVNPADCTLVVTLEPCNHYGKTPPCAQAILDAGIRHVVIGAMDPTPTAGGGANFLMAHGVTVENGVAEAVCQDLIKDFLHWQTTALPFVTLKLASTLDGRIATRAWASRWISGPLARRRVHDLRAVSHAVMVGGVTFRKDNPLLTVRDASAPAERSAPWTELPARPGAGQASEGALPQSGLPSPLAVIVTSRLPEPHEPYHLLRERAGETVFLVPREASGSAKARALQNAGLRVLGASTLKEGLERLRGEYGVYRLLCEGGGRLGMELLEKGLANEFEWHMAPKILGDNSATPLFNGRQPLEMKDALGLSCKKWGRLGDDMIFLFEKGT